MKAMVSVLTKCPTSIKKLIKARMGGTYPRQWEAEVKLINDAVYVKCGTSWVHGKFFYFWQP